MTDILPDRDELSPQMTTRAGDEHGAYELTRRVMAANAEVGDGQEGMSAFLGKRALTWSGS